MTHMGTAQMGTAQNEGTNVGGNPPKPGKNTITHIKQ